MSEEDQFEKFRHALLLQNQEINSLSEKVGKLSALNSHLLGLIQESGTLPAINDSDDYIATLRLIHENGRPKQSPKVLKSSTTPPISVKEILMTNHDQPTEHQEYEQHLSESKRPNNPKINETESNNSQISETNRLLYHKSVSIDWDPPRVHAGYHSEEFDETEEDEVFPLNGMRKSRRSRSTVSYPTQRVTESSITSQRANPTATNSKSFYLQNNNNNAVIEDNNHEIEVYQPYEDDQSPSEEEIETDPDPFQHSTNMMTTSLFMKRPNVSDHFDTLQFVDDYAISDSNEAFPNANNNHFQRKYNSMRNHRQSRHDRANNDISETLLSSFESLRLARSKELKRTNQINTKSTHKPQQKLVYPPEVIRGISKLNALVRGYLVRRVMQSDKVHIIIKTIKDTAEFAINIQKDSSQRTSTNQDSILKQRIIAQLRSSLHEIHEIFFEWPLDQRLALVTYTRQAEKHREHEARILERQLEIHGAPVVTTESKVGTTPRISAATMKRRIMKDSTSNPTVGKTISQQPIPSSKHFMRVQSARYSTNKPTTSQQPVTHRKKSSSTSNNNQPSITTINSAETQRKRITANLNQKQNHQINPPSTNKVLDSVSEDTSNSSSIAPQSISLSRIPQSSSGPSHNSKRSGFNTKQSDNQKTQN